MQLGLRLKENMSQSSKKGGTSGSAMPSPNFTYAATYTVPRSSPMLSSSFTPFYPRSLSQSASPYDAHKSHLYVWRHVTDPNMYNQSCYTSSASDPYNVCWVSDNGNGWTGGAWQSGNSMPEEYVYADDEAEDSAYLHSDSLSYYEESSGMEHELYACSTSNTAFVPTLHADPGAALFSLPHSKAKSEQVREQLTPSLKNSCTQDQAYCAFGKQGSAKITSNEKEMAFSCCKMDAWPFSIQASSQMCSSFGILSPIIEPNMKQATTGMTENGPVHLNSSKPSNLSYSDSKPLEAIESKYSIQATSNSADTLEILEGINLNAPAMSTISADVNQTEANNGNGMPYKSSSSQLPSTSGQCPCMTIPKHINTQAHCSFVTETASLEQRNTGSRLNRSSLAMEMEGKLFGDANDREAMHQGKTGSSCSLPENAWLYLNEPQLLVKCIHNLSKVLLSNQSGSILDPTDYFTIENTICILSQRLYQSSMNEETFSKDQASHQVAEQEPNISDDKEGGKKDFQQKSPFLLEGLKHKAKTVSASGVLENEELHGSLPKVTVNSYVEGDGREDQISFVKKGINRGLEDLLTLQCNVTKLQEKVAYERSESNATVQTYKKLWMEAQEVLKISRLEIKELRTELASLKQDFTNLKHSECLSGPGGLPSDLESTKYDMKTSCINQGGFFSQCFMERDLHCAPNDNTFCGNPNEPFLACSDVVTNYFGPESISNARENWSPNAKGEEMTLNYNKQSGKMSEVSAGEPSPKHIGGKILEDEVTQRLSLLLARQGLDLNKTCIAGNVELPSDLITSSDSSFDLPREGETLLPDRKGSNVILSETSYTAIADKELEGAKADLSFQMKSAFELNYGDHHGVQSVVQRQSNARTTEGVNVEAVNMSMCQEDDIEIICLKPGAAESSLTYFKGDSEWEHVVVNALDVRNTIG